MDKKWRKSVSNSCHSMLDTPDPSLRRFQVYERAGILLVEVYERVGKSVIWVCERAQTGWAHEFYGFIKPKKRFYFGNWFLFKRQCISEFLTKYVKGVPFVNRRYTKALPFSWKMVYKRVRGWISKRSLPPPPRIWKFVEYPPGLKPFYQRAHFSGWNWTFTAGPQK